MEQPQETKRGTIQYRSLTVPTIVLPISKSQNKHVTTTLIRETTITPIRTTTPLIEEGLVKDEQTNEVYLPITSTVVLKRKPEVFYMFLDFDNYLTVDAWVESRAYVSAVAQINLNIL